MLATFVLRLSLVCGCFFAMCCPLHAQTPGANLDAVIANAKKSGDQKALTRATNLKAGLALLKPSDISGVRCGKDTNPTAIDVDKAQDLAGELLDKALEKYLPTLAAALASAPAAALTAFFTPEKIGTDSVEILNQSNQRPNSEVREAAREMLQDTTIDNFRKVPKALMAKIVVCSL
jgi:hypothetical protein